MKTFFGILITVILISATLYAEPYVATTANRMAAGSGWGVLWGKLLLFLFILYPVFIFGILFVLSKILKLPGLIKKRWIIGLLLLPLLPAGFAYMLFIFIIISSVGYVNISPIIYYCIFAGFVIVITITYLVFACIFENKSKQHTLLENTNKK